MKKGKGLKKKDATAQTQDLSNRQQAAQAVRTAVSQDAFNDFDTTPPQNNGDEERFEALGFPGFASFTKALQHDPSGLVMTNSFQSLLNAIETGTQAAFNQVQLGGSRRLVNPLNAFSYQLIGNDSNGAPEAPDPAPAFADRKTALDMVERYWMALCRDVSFEEYGSNGLIQDACDDLNGLGFQAEFGLYCTPQTLFRGPYQGCDVGPYVSQFLLQDFNFGHQSIRQSHRYPKECLDYMTDLETWKQINNGEIDPTGTDVLSDDGYERYIISLRDAGQWVHLDLPHQSSLWATIILLAQDNQYENITDGSPYVNGQITTATAFGSLGDPDITITSALGAVYALKHAWFQKWAVHRRLRPEVYAQRLELFRRGEDPFVGGLTGNLFQQLFGDGADVWQNTTVLNRILQHNSEQNTMYGRGDRDGTYLLPMGFPEGSPTHPSYPGGHSVVIAAGATIAKAFFRDQVINYPKIPSPQDPNTLISYSGPSLTVHGELNKLIANITMFRDAAGMHWRTDGTTSGNPGTTVPTGGNLLGESMAISMLRDLKQTYSEENIVFQFTSLTGRPITI